MNQKFRYRGPHDWEKIERLHNRGATVAVIADERNIKNRGKWARVK